MAKGKNLAVYILKLTSKAPFSKDFSLRDQIRRIEYIDKKSFEHIEEERNAISGMLAKLVNARS